jgi:hypothetical protein
MMRAGAPVPLKLLLRVDLPLVSLLLLLLLCPLHVVV